MVKGCPLNRDSAGKFYPCKLEGCAWFHEINKKCSIQFLEGTGFAVTD